MGLKEMRAARPSASTWDKISARRAKQTLENREIFDGQQIDRGTLKDLKSARPGWILAGVLGVLAAIATWVLISVVMAMVVSTTQAFSESGEDSSQVEVDSYYKEATVIENGVRDCYRLVNEDGFITTDSPCYDTPEEVPIPQWYTDAMEEQKAAEASEAAGSGTEGTEASVGVQLAKVTFWKVYTAGGVGLAVFVIVGTWNARRVAVANLMADTTDINQHSGDQHIATPEEIQRAYDWFPDAGAHSGVQVSSMLSHMMLSQKGLGEVEMVRRTDKDVIDQDGNIVLYAGEALEDEAGDYLTTTVPLIDEAFGTALFDASELPNQKEMRRRYSAAVIPYNPGGKDRDKLGEHDTVADHIKAEWTFPEYEIQRPAGAYIVDTAPVNTMVLAMTRAGKGQTYIEPTIDMWSRESRPSNMVINDPKGELLVKFYVPLVTRGFEPVQFNLINAMKTDIYNPLGMAAEAAREGDSTKCALYVENIADVFFPLDGGEDPVWPNAANNAFKRAAYGLIDYYLEEERELRAHAAEVGMDPGTLEDRLDEIWGRVTLYNCYQLFVQLTSKKMKNPEAELEQQRKDGEWDGREDEFDMAMMEVEEKAKFWEGKAEQDMLTLYFNATEALPRNMMRTLIGNANNALRAMAGAEKMLASVYGIAITAMSFFTDPTISTLTSGRPSQNTDLGGLSFPRRFGVRLAPDFLARYHLIGQQAVWSAYADPMFTEDLGKDFAHSDIVSREGWARYYFKGTFEKSRAWVKLELRNPQTKMLVRTFYFEFTKAHQLSLSGRHYVVEPVTGEKQIKNGVLREMRPVREGGKRDGKIERFEYAETRFTSTRLVPDGEYMVKESVQARALTQSMVRYSEKPKAVFLVTPPHLRKYAKLLLILVKQLVDLNFDKSYMTKSNQKPLYKTRFMLDELGNLQSDGQGIAGFETMLSIGLGQDQQFTIILQTLQQLRDVYGESVDKIVQGNVANIIFLKSTDDSMIQTLETMSGTRHVSYIDSKQISQDLEKVVGNKNEGKVSYTMSTVKEPLISYNDLAFLAPRNSIVYRAGDAPIWNRNETILPMSWRLLKNSITHPGNEYTLQTIPTLSSAIEFDVRSNQPDFTVLLEKRLAQAAFAKEAKERYADAYEYREIDIERLDPDVYSDEVMEIITMLMADAAGHDPHEAATVDPESFAAMNYGSSDEEFLENTELAVEVEKRAAAQLEREKKIYAEGQISKDMLVSPNGAALVKSLDLEIAEAYKRSRNELVRDTRHFSVGGDGSLRSADGSTEYITPTRSEEHAEAARKLSGKAKESGSRVYAEDELSPEDLAQFMSVEVHAAFYLFLAEQPTWEHLADGEFDRAMAVEMRS